MIYFVDISFRTLGKFAIYMYMYTLYNLLAIAMEFEGYINKENWTIINNSLFKWCFFKFRFVQTTTQLHAINVEHVQNVHVCSM